MESMCDLFDLIGDFSHFFLSVRLSIFSLDAVPDS